MIFVTVGTARQPFTRLLEAVDALAATPEFREQAFFVQTGHADFEPRHCEWKKFLDRDEFLDCMERAEMVVCHGGGACILQANKSGKVPVALPRLGSLDEALDDHQVDLVATLEQDGRAVALEDPTELAAALERARELTRTAKPARESDMVRLVCNAIEELIGPPPGPKRDA
jgi:UDP-N-acetylglucosamine transferase subunit ALG13